MAADSVIKNENNIFSGLKFRVDLTLQDLSPQLLNIMQIVCKLV